MKWAGIILLFLILGITITVMARQNMKYERPYPAITASTDSVIIMKGKHLVFGAAHCAECHSKTNVDSLLKLGQVFSIIGRTIFCYLPRYFAIRPYRFYHKCLHSIT